MKASDVPKSKPYDNMMAMMEDTVKMAESAVTHSPLKNTHEFMDSPIDPAVPEHLRYVEISSHIFVWNNNPYTAGG